MTAFICFLLGIGMGMVIALITLGFGAMCRFGGAAAEVRDGD